MRKTQWQLSRVHERQLNQLSTQQLTRSPRIQYPVIMISEVNLSQNASSPSEHDKPKKMKNTIVAEKTMDTMVYPRWIWMRRALSRGRYLFKLLLENVAIVYLLMVNGIKAIWKRTEQEQATTKRFISGLDKISESAAWQHSEWQLKIRITYWHASNQTQGVEQVASPSTLVQLLARHPLVAGTWSEQSELNKESSINVRYSNMSRVGSAYTVRMGNTHTK